MIQSSCFRNRAEPVLNRLGLYEVSKSGTTPHCIFAYATQQCLFVLDCTYSPFYTHSGFIQSGYLTIAL